MLILHSFTIENPEWGNDCQPMGYIGKLDSNGNWLWVDKFDGIKDQRGSRDNRLAIDNFSNIYVVGGFQERGPNQVATYGPFSLSSPNSGGMVLFLRWIRTVIGYGLKVLVVIKQTE